jgi:hypothetical protein
MVGEGASASVNSSVIAPALDAERRRRPKEDARADSRQLSVDQRVRGRTPKDESRRKTRRRFPVSQPIPPVVEHYWFSPAFVAGRSSVAIGILSLAERKTRDRFADAQRASVGVGEMVGTLGQKWCQMMPLYAI